MILIIFEVISIIVIAIGHKVPLNPILVLWLSYHICKNLVRYLYSQQSNWFKRYFSDKNIVIINKHDFDDN